MVQVGSVIGALWTIFLVVFTAVVGAFLLRVQGFATVQRLRDSTARGEVPALPLIEGALLLFAGALLLTPGFFTDAVGFVILTPPLRHRLAQAVFRRGVWFAAGQSGVYTRQSSTQSSTEEPGQRTIEGEFQRKED